MSSICLTPSIARLLCFCWIVLGGVLHFGQSVDRQVLAADQPGEFVPLFNQKDLSEWDGDLSLWKLDDGVIVGDSAGIQHNQFLATKKTYENFELKFEFRLKNGAGNSGVQFRSVRVPNSTEVSGYQADIGDGYWGCLYDESRRNRILMCPSAEAKPKLATDDWIRYSIRAVGAEVVLTLNDQETVKYIEDDAAIARNGMIALQVHSGGPLKIEFRNLMIREFPGGSTATSSLIPEPQAERVVTVSTPIELTPAQVHAKLVAKEDFLFLDCREADEYAIVKIAGTTLLPMSELASRLQELAPAKNRAIVVHCHHGGRSLKVANWLRQQGFEQASSMSGGIDQWAVEIDSTLARY